ncbi:MAG: hypothetical protein HFH11_03120 [Dorea sp.]|nr:hypothetical protein [Dorea sp.]MCI9270139.1 hypothetical protein [Dorea sp.]
MTKLQAFKRIRHYLKSHFIYFETDFYDGTPRFTMIFKNCDNCPDKILESCVYFYHDCMEVKTYFNQNAANWCKEYQENLTLVIRLLNHINATVWMRSTDGVGGALYAPSILYTPRIFVTEYDCYDITLATLIPYDFYEIAPLETEDYITAYCPDLLNKLSPAIFHLLLGTIDLQQAMHCVDKLAKGER